LLAAALTLAAQGSRPASRPAAIAVGDSIELPLDALPADGATFRISVSVLEPHRLLAESCDSDVSIPVEEETGKAIARDENSGNETDALLHWSPERIGAYRIRVGAAGTRSQAKSGLVVRVLRGALAAEPAA